MLNVVVIDAQGGGLGAAIVKKLRDRYGDQIDILALGTNVAATTAMKKSGAACCATGENAICFNLRSADVIMGGIGIIASCGMLGEITPLMARAVAESSAKKILIPMSKCNIIVPGTLDLAVKDLIDTAVDAIAPML
ncbi:MAG: DUF3842 family protein [Eubacteriales bacterium]|nr:DUF3842 family protein [Eubacteriales bacterium]